MRAFYAFTFAALLALVGPALAGAPALTAPPKPAAVAFSEADQADLKRISVYLNGIKGIQGHFLQVGPDGQSEQGTFYLRKPGRMRFEYGPPNPNLIISDGTTIAVENSDLKTTDRYPLLDSPLRLVLSDNVDLANDARIRSLRREAGLISVTARQASGPAQGQITLTFADAGTGGLELRQWEVLDAQGGHTSVVIKDMKEAANLPPQLFIIQDLSPFKRNER